MPGSPRALRSESRLNPQQRSSGSDGEDSRARRRLSRDEIMAISSNERKKAVEGTTTSCAGFATTDQICCADQEPAAVTSHSRMWRRLFTSHPRPHPSLRPASRRGRVDDSAARRGCVDHTRQFQWRIHNEREDTSGLRRGRRIAHAGRTCRTRQALSLASPIAAAAVQDGKQVTTEVRWRRWESSPALSSGRHWRR